MELTTKPKKDLLACVEEFFGEVWKQKGTKSVIYLTYGAEAGWGIIVPAQQWDKDGIGFYDLPDHVECPADVEIVGEIIATEAFK